MGASKPAARRSKAHYGIGELTAVTILAELGDASRFSSSRDVVRYAGLDITVKQSDQRRSPGHLSRQGPPALRWALYEAAQVARRQTAPTAPTTCRPPSGSAVTAHASPSRGSFSSAATTRSASSAKRRSSLLENAAPRARQALTHTDALRPAPENPLPTRSRGRPRKNERPQQLPPSGITPSNITSPSREPTPGRGPK